LYLRWLAADSFKESRATQGVAVRIERQGTKFLANVPSSATRELQRDYADADSKAKQ
jgi:hypothetical protein